jgi:hypothetical protein
MDQAQLEVGPDTLEDQIIGVLFLSFIFSSIKKVSMPFQFRNAIPTVVGNDLTRPAHLHVKSLVGPAIGSLCSPC